MTDIDEYLEHFGIKGMKWGVRRSSFGGSTSKPSSRRTSDQVKIDQRKTALVNRRKLSDKDLDQLVKRLEMEKKLKNLVEEDIAPGKTIANRLIKNAGTKAATAILAGGMVYGLKTAMTGKFDIKDAASYMTPKLKSK